MNRKTGKREKMSHAPDHELLLRYLREEPDASQLERLTESDWHNLIQQARSHAVLYLLYHRLKTQNLDSLLPVDTLQTVRAEYFESAWRNNNLYNDLSKILKALHRENIPVILLKGAHLAQTVYSNIALRPMGDIDILVRKTDLLKAKEQLLELGYIPLKETDIATACAGYQHLPPMIKQDAPPVELHWTLEAPTCPFKIDIEELWQRAQPVSVAGVDALTLSPEDLLLHLCLHTSAHHLYSNGLRAFCDIREIIRHYRKELDWEDLLLRTREWEASNAVYLTMHLAKLLLGAEVPDKFLDRLRPESWTPQSVVAAKAFIFSGSDVDNRLSVNSHTRKLFSSKSTLKITALFWQRIFLPRKKMAERYDISPDSLRIPLCYPVRLKDLLVRYTQTVWRIWRRDKATVQQFHLVDWLSR